METSDTLRAEIRFKNARLYNAIVDESVCFSDPADKRAVARHAVGPVNAFCRLHGFSNEIIYAYLNLRKTPFRRGPNGSIRLTQTGQRLCGIFGVDPEWLFPPELYQRNIRPIAIEGDHRLMLRISEVPAMKLALPPCQESSVLDTELRDTTSAVLATLTPREESIIRDWFGIDGEAETLAAIAKKWRIDRSRVHQVITKAIRKLRHPSRARHLEAWWMSGDIYADRTT